MRSSSLVVAALVAISCSDNIPPAGGTLPPVGLGDSCLVTNCRTGLVCDPMTSICKGGGTGANGDPCSIGVSCMSGQCEPNGPTGKCGPAGAGNLGDGCRGDADCSSGLRCGFDGVSLFPKCVAAGTGDVGKTCASSNDCTQGLFCSAGQCTQVPVLAVLAPNGYPPIIPDPTLQWQGASCPPNTTSPVKALFELPRMTDPASVQQDFFRLPFPNDAARQADGSLDFSRFPRDPNPPFGFDALGRYLDVLKTEPFGNYGTVIFRFDGPVSFLGFGIEGMNPQTRFVDLTPDPARFGTIRGIAYQLHGTRDHYVCDTWFAVRSFTGDAMRPGIYGVILLNGITDLSNVPVQPSPDFTAMVAGSAPQDPRLTAAYTAYAPLRQYLLMSSIPPSGVLVASVFTVGDGERLVKSLQQSVAALPVPAADPWVKCGTGAVEPCPDATGPRACGSSALFDEWHSVVTLPIFQAGTPPYLSPDQGGGIDPDGGVLAPVRSEKICAALTIPKGTPPANGWPLVLYAHGTGGSYRLHADDGSGAALASVLIDGGSADGGPLPGGYAVLGFDQVGHGPRRGDAGQTTSPDDIVFNFANPASARGTMTQGAADLFGFAAYAKAINTPDSGLPVLDATHLVFWGHSQGSTEGAMFLAHDRSVEGSVLSGASASLTDALLSKKSPTDIADVMWVALDESQPSDVDSSHPVLSLLQSWTDPADPVNFARTDVNVPLSSEGPAFSRNLFQVWGRYDTYTAQPVQSTYTAAAGLTFVGPQVDDYGGTPVASAMGNTGQGHAVTAAMRQYDPGDGGYDGHFVVFFNDQAKHDAVHFLVRSASGDVPLVPEP